MPLPQTRISTCRPRAHCTWHAVDTSGKTNTMTFYRVSARRSMALRAQSVINPTTESTRLLNFPGKLKLTKITNGLPKEKNPVITGKK